MAKAPKTGPTPLPGLRIEVATLRRRGVDRHHVSTELPPVWLGDVLEGTDAEVRDPGHVEVEILLPTDGAVIATGRLAVGFSVPCGRCLEPAAVDGAAQLSATFVVGTILPGPTGSVGESGDEEEDGLGLGDDDLDTWLYDGTAVLLDELVAEHVKLAYPMRALCPRGESCRGLCSNCGHDLNTPQSVTRSATAGGCCANCGRPVGPIVGDPDSAQSAEPDQDGPLAEALRKLQLPD